MYTNNNQQEASFDPSLLKELQDQAHHPPGGDKIIATFYKTSVKMINSNQKIASILMKIRKNRPKITHKHLVNLLFRAYQAIKFEQKDFSYKSFTTIKQWQTALNNILSNNKTRKYFIKLLTEKSTTTTIYNRYAGPYALIALIWGNRPVEVADLGCGGNYGLRGIELRQPFKEIKDHTPGKILSILLEKRTNLKMGLAIDRENPDDPQTRSWRQACSFYPKELDKIKEVINFEKQILRSKKVQFLQADLTTYDKISTSPIDVIILSSVLYQFNEADQSIVLMKAKNTLKPGGIIIVQDFAAKDLHEQCKLDFKESWFGKSFTYKTFVIGQSTGWNFWEIFRWKSGRCTIVKKGKDFSKLFTVYPVSSAKAALAHSTS